MVPWVLRDIALDIAPGTISPPSNPSPGVGADPPGFPPYGSPPPLSPLPALSWTMRWTIPSWFRHWTFWPILAVTGSGENELAPRSPRMPTTVVPGTDVVGVVAAGGFGAVAPPWAPTPPPPQLKARPA